MTWAMSLARLGLVALMPLLAASVMAAPPIEAYGRLPAVQDILLAPGGERFATIAVLDGQRHLIVAGVDGKLLRRASVDQGKTGGFWWAGDDHVLVEMRSTYKSPLQLQTGQLEMYQVFSLAISSGKTMAIFQKSPGIGNFVLGSHGWAIVDGHTYGYFEGMTYVRSATGELIANPADHYIFGDLYQVDLDTGKATRIARGSERHRSWVVGSDGTVLAHDEYVRRESTWRLYKGKDHEQLLLEVSAPVESPSLLGRGRSSASVLILDASAGRDVLREVAIGRDASRSEDLLQDAGGARPLWQPDGERLLLGLATADPDFPDIFSAPLRARIRGVKKAFPGYKVRVTSFSRSLDRLIAFTDGKDDSGTYWMVDIRSGKANPIGYAYPKIRAADVGPTRMFEYQAADGLDLDGVLTLPPGRNPRSLPVVVLPHGGPLGVRDSWGFDWWAQAIASAGYAVLQPNFRGSGGRGAAFRAAGLGEWGGKMLGDIADGLAALAREGIIDPQRACIVGASYGGYAALAGVTLQQGLYRCAVSVAGPADLPAFLHWIREKTGGDSQVSRALWLTIGADRGGVGATSRYSPSDLASRADAPILLIHGIDDTVVPIAQSEAMADALKSAGKPVEFIRMKGEDHWLSRDETRTAMLRATLEFVKRHNPAD